MLARSLQRAYLSHSSPFAASLSHSMRFVASASPRWSLVATTGSSDHVAYPQARCGMAVGVDSERQRLIVHGGDISTPPIGAATYDRWQLDLAEKTWQNTTIGAVSTGEKPKQPDARWGHVLASLSSSRLLLFGGSDSQKRRMGDCWVMEADGKWEEVEDQNAPSARDLVSLTAIRDNALVLIGGRHVTDSPAANDEVHLFDCEKMSWKQLKSENGPGGLSGHSAVYVEEMNAVAVYGGWYSVIYGTPLLWLYHLDSETWECLESDAQSASGPGVRGGHVGGTLDGGKTMTVAFGFKMVEGVPVWSVADTWNFDFGVREWREVKGAGGPEGRVDARSVVVPTATGDRWLVFGGENHQRLCTNELWECKLE